MQPELLRAFCDEARDKQLVKFDRFKIKTRIDWSELSWLQRRLVNHPDEVIAAEERYKYGPRLAQIETWASMCWPRGMQVLVALEGEEYERLQKWRGAI